MLVAAALRPLDHVHVSVALGLECVQQVADESDDPSLADWTHTAHSGLPVLGEIDTG